MTEIVPDPLPPPAKEPGLSSGDRDAITESLTHMYIHDGLGASARGHVLAGDAPWVLERLVATIGGAPYIVGMYSGHRALQRVLLAPEGWDAAIIGRLGSVLATVLGGDEVRHSRGRAAGAASLRVLAGVTEIYLSQMSGPPPPARWLLNGPQCLELLRLEGADQAALVWVLCSAFTMPCREEARFTHLLEMAGLPEVLAAAPERAIAGARALSATARFHAIGLLERSGLARHPAFHELLFETLAGDSVQAREAALHRLLRGDRDRLTQEASRRLRSPPPSARVAAVRVLLRIDTPQARALLEQHRAQEGVTDVRREIETSLQWLQAHEGCARIPARGKRGYVAIDGTWVDVPEAPPLPPDTPPPAGLGEALRTVVDEFLCGGMGVERSAFDNSRRLRNKSLAVVDETLKVMSGRLHPWQVSTLTARVVCGRTTEDEPWQVGAMCRRTLEELLSRPGITPQHLARLLALSFEQKPIMASVLVSDAHRRVPAQLLRRMARETGDLRPVLAACEPFGAGGEALLRALLPLPHLPYWAPEAPPPLWQVVAGHPDLIEQALTQRGPPALTHAPIRVRALKLLALLPALPLRHRQTLRELTTGPGTRRARSRAPSWAPHPPAPGSFSPASTISSRRSGLWQQSGWRSGAIPRRSRCCAPPSPGRRRTMYDAPCSRASMSWAMTSPTCCPTCAAKQGK